MKTKVEIIADDGRYHDYKKGQVGYIDGYMRGGDDTPLACIVTGDRVIMVPLYFLKVLPDIRSTPEYKKELVETVQAMSGYPAHKKP